MSGTPQTPVAALTGEGLAATGRDAKGVTCPTCGQRWSVSNAIASPGYRALSSMATRVPVVDIDGRTVGHRWQSGEVWISDGPNVTATHGTGDGLTGDTSWPCGDHVASIPRTIYDRTACLACRPVERWSKTVPEPCACCGPRRGHLIPRVPPEGYSPPTCGATP